MSIAERRAVPLKSRCSRKCVEPWWPVASSREPTPTQQPKVTERRPGMRLGEHPDAAGEDGAAHDGAAPPPRRRSGRGTRAGPAAGVRRHVRRSTRASACRRRSAVSDVGRRLAVGRRRTPRRRATGTSESLPRGSISVISTWTFWPTASTSSTFSTRLPPTSLRICEMCSRPSLPGKSETNAPNVVGLDDGAEEPLADLGHGAGWRSR